MKTVAKKKNKAKMITLIAILTFIVGFFATDFVRTKMFDKPPVFSVQIIDYQNGSYDYYGLGYKIWEDYHPVLDTTEYYFGFWFVPKFVKI